MEMVRQIITPVLRLSIGAWTEEALKLLPTRQLIQLCRDPKSWHKDLLRHPAPPCRVFLDGRKTRFEQIVFLDETVFLFVPRLGNGHTRTARPDRSGNLKYIGHLPQEEYSYLFRTTWLGFACQVMLGPEEVEEWRSNTNHGSIRYWVAGHWRQLPFNWKAHQIKHDGEDRRRIGMTWVRQYHVHWNNGEPCRCCETETSQE